MERFPSMKSSARQAVRATRLIGSATPLLRSFDHGGDAAALARELVVLLLPRGRTVRWGDLDGGHLVFRTIRRPVRIFGGDDVGLCSRVMERGVDDAGGHPLGDQGAQRGRAGAARELHPVAVADAALLGVVRMNLEAVLFVPDDVGG